MIGVDAALFKPSMAHTPMTTSDVVQVLVRELEGARREVGLFPDDDTLWRTPPGLPNSAGNLAVHLAGNIQHYIGAMLGQTGYTRDREGEFSTRTGARQSVMDELAKAVAVVRTTLPTLTAEQLAEPAVDRELPSSLSLGRFLLHLATHAAYHLGQIDYARRLVTGDSTSAGVLSIREICD